MLDLAETAQEKAKSKRRHIERLQNALDSARSSNEQLETRVRELTDANESLRTESERQCDLLRQDLSQVTDLAKRLEAHVQSLCRDREDIASELRQRVEDDARAHRERDEFARLAEQREIACAELRQTTQQQQATNEEAQRAIAHGYVGVVVKVLLPTGHLVDVRLISYPALLAELFAKVLDEVDVPCNEQLFVQGDRRVDFRRRLDRITAHFELDQHIVLCISKHAPTPADHERVTVHFASLTGERFSGTFVLGQATVADARMWIRRHTGIPEDSQRLIFRGRQLCNPERSLADEGVLPGSKIHITLCLSGC